MDKTNNANFPKEKASQKKSNDSTPRKSARKARNSVKPTKKAKTSKRTANWRKAQAEKGIKQLNLMAPHEIWQELKTINKEAKKGAPLDQIWLDLLLCTKNTATTNQKEMICKFINRLRAGDEADDIAYLIFEETVLSGVPENERKLLKLFVEKCKAGAPLDEFFYEMFELTTSQEVLNYISELEGFATRRSELELGIKVNELVGVKRKLVMHILGN